VSADKVDKIKKTLNAEKAMKNMIGAVKTKELTWFLIKQSSENLR
jgi:hypothetical protein